MRLLVRGERAHGGVLAQRDEGGPVVGVWLALSQREHGLTQGGGAALAREQGAVVGLHQQARGSVIDLPQARDDRLGSRDDQGAAQAIDTLAQLDVASGTGASSRKKPWVARWSTPGVGR